MSDYDRLSDRVRNLPKQLEATRKKLYRLEAEARQHKMWDLLEEPRK